MKLKLLLSAGLLACVMAASSKSALADFGSSSIQAYHIIDGTSTSGMWHVTVSNAGPANVWHIHAVADSADVPSESVEHLQIAFYSSSSAAQTAGSALAIMVADPDNGQLTPGAAWSGGVQIGGGGLNKQFNSDGSIGQFLMPDGSNVWDGTVTVSGSTNIKSVAVRLDDTTVSWRGSADIVPEASSLALLLPGILPLGIIFRYRKRSQK